MLLSPILLFFCLLRMSQRLKFWKYLNRFTPRIYRNLRHTLNVISNEIWTGKTTEAERKPFQAEIHLSVVQQKFPTVFQVFTMGRVEGIGFGVITASKLSLAAGCFRCFVSFVGGKRAAGFHMYPRFCFPFFAVFYVFMKMNFFFISDLDVPAPFRVPLLLRSSNYLATRLIDSAATSRVQYQGKFSFTKPTNKLIRNRAPFVTRANSTSSSVYLQS